MTHAEIKEMLNKPNKLTASESKLLGEFVRSPRTRRTRRKRYQLYLQSKCWRTRRLKILKRAKGLCEKCLLVPPVHIHHLSYERIGREKNTDLMALCKECHYSFHNRWGNWKQFKAVGTNKSLLTE